MSDKNSRWYWNIVCSIMLFLFLVNTATAALTTQYVDDIVYIKNGATPLATVQSLNKLNWDGHSYSLGDCGGLDGLFNCAFVVNVTPSFNYTFDSGTKIDGLIRSASKGNTSLQSIEILTPRLAQYTEPNCVLTSKDECTTTIFDYMQCVPDDPTNTTITTCPSPNDYLCTRLMFNGSGIDCTNITKDVSPICTPTQVYICSDVSKARIVWEWKPFDTSNLSVIAGTSYQFRLKYSKTDMTDDVDLIPKLFGVQLSSWAWWNTSWTYGIPVVINSTSTTTLTSFPARVTISTSNATLWNTTTCTNVRFLDNDNATVLDYELDAANSTFCGNATNNATFWVRIPSLTAGNYTIYAYLGNIAAASGENKSGVWSPAGYVGVFHMTEVGATTLVDSVNLNNLTQQGTCSANSSAVITTSNNMLIGYGMNSSKSPICYYTKASAVGLPKGSGAFTESANIYMTTDNGWNFVMGHGAIGGNGEIEMAYDAAGGQEDRFLAVIDSAGAADDYVAWQESVPATTWTHVVLASAGGSAPIYSYRNSTANNSVSLTMNIVSGNLSIGNGASVQWGGANMQFGGVIDEVRIRNASSTAAWQQAEYMQWASFGATDVAPSPITINNVTLSVNGLGATANVALIVNHLNATKCNYGAIVNDSATSTTCTLYLASNTLSSNGVVYANDSGSGTVNWAINYTLTNNTFVQNNTIVSNDSLQYHLKNDTLTINAGGNETKYIINHTTLLDGASMKYNVGQNFTGAATIAAVVTFSSTLQGDWINNPVEAYTQNTTGTQNATRNDFNGTMSYTGNLSMIGAVNFTYTLPISPALGGTCTGVTMTYPSNTSYCYQESANVSTACGGLSTGSYTTASLTTPANTYDGNWATSSYTDNPGYGEMYVYYRKPSNIQTASSYWQVKDDGGTTNLTLAADCWNYNSTHIKLQAVSTYTPIQTIWRCYDSTNTLQALRTNTAGYHIFEEAMYWDAPALINLSVGSTYILNTSIQADCINDGAFGSFAVLAGATNVSQTVQSNASWASLWTGSLTGVYFERAAEGTACWTSGTQALSGTKTIATSATIVSANQSGDCVTESASGAFALLAGYTNASQTVQSNATITNGDSAYTFPAIAFSRAAEGHSCWTSGTQQLSGTYVLTGASVVASVNQSGDCVNESAFGSFVVLGTPTEAAQTVQSNGTLESLDTDFTFSVPWSRAAEGTACWTSGTQQLSGTATLAGTNLTLNANQSGDCVTDGTYGAWALKTGSTNASQTVQANRTATNLDSYALNGLVFSDAAEGTACWTSGTQQLSGTYNLAGSGTYVVSKNQTGDCITEGTFGSFALVVGYTNASQTVQSNVTITSGDSAYTFPAIAWTRAVEGSVCWTDATQLTGTYILTGASVTVVANQSGDCIVEGSFGSFGLVNGYTNSSQTIQSNDTITSSDTDFYFGAIPWTKAVEGSTCWTTGTQQITGNYILGANASYILSANQTGDCIYSDSNFTAFALNGTPTESSQQVLSTNTMISGDTDFYFGSLAWTRAAEGTTCWTSGAQLLSGNYILGANASIVINATQSGDCVADGSYGGYILLAGYTNSSQTVQNNRTASNGDTYAFNGLAFTGSAEGSACWTSGAQALSGSYNLAGSGTYVVSLNQTGDCIAGDSNFSSFAVNGTSTESSQQILSTNTIYSDDTDIYFGSLAFSRAAEGTACWTSGTQQLSGNYILGKNATLLLNTTQTGDCITDGTFGSFALLAGSTNNSQTVQKNRTATNGDTYAFSGVAFSTTAEGDTCWTSGTQQLSGTYNLGGSGTYVISANQSGDCITEGTFGSFVLIAGYSNASQTVQSNNTITSGDSAYTFPAIAWTRVAEGSSCWTSGTQQLSGNYILTGSSIIIPANQSGDCIAEGAFGAFAVNGTPTESSQNIRSLNVVNSSDTDFTFSVPWSRAVEGTTCWTSGTQQLSGTCVLGSSCTIYANQTGDCITDGTLGPWALLAGYTNTSQSLQRNRTASNDDSFAFTGVTFTGSAEGSSCWTSSTQQLNGSYNLGGSGTYVVSLNQSGDCILGDSNFSSFAVNGTPTESAQQLLSTNALYSGDIDFYFGSLAWTRAAEGTACWTSGTQLLSGNYILGSNASITLNSTQEGDCITDGTWGAFGLNPTVTNASQSIQKNRTATNGDTYAFSGLTFSTAAEGSSCWTSGTQQLSGSYNLAGSGNYILSANQTGDCITEAVFGSYALIAGYTNASQTVQSNSTITSGDTDFYFPGISWTRTAEGSSCWTSGTQQLSGTYILGANSSIIIPANQTGDCITEGTFGSYVLLAGYSNTSQIVQSNNTITNEDTGFYFGPIAWSRAAEGSACWTSGTQQISGNYVLGANATMTLSANQTGDCVDEGTFGAFIVNGTPTESSQNIRSLNVINSSDTGFTFSIPWTRAAEGTACWTSGTQALSGTCTLGSSCTIYANQTGDCITDGTLGGWGLLVGYTNTSQTVQNNRTVTNGDGYAFAGVAFTGSAEGSTCWTSGAQALSGTYDLAGSGTYLVSLNQTGDCILGDSNFSSYAVNGTPTEAAQQLLSTNTIYSGDTDYYFGSLAWARAADGTACWTSGTQLLSGNFILGKNASLLLNATQTGDCITDGTWGSFGLNPTVTNSSQSIQKNRTATNGDNYAFSGVAFSTANEGSVCWTSGTQALSGTYVLPASSIYVISANQTGDCIVEDSFGAYALIAGFTNASQTIQSNDTITSSDTDFYFPAIAWTRAVSGNSCWESGTQQRTGNYVLGANASMVLSANQTGDCILGDSNFSSFALKAGYTNASQTVQSNNTVYNNDTGFYFGSLAWTRAVEGSACWTDVTQLTGTYTLGANASVVIVSNSSGDCIAEGAFGAFAVNGTPTESSQNIRSLNVINSSDTGYTFSVPWSRAAEGTACWTTGTQQLTGTCTLGSSCTIYANQTGDCISDGTYGVWRLAPTYTNSSQSIQRNRTAINDDSYAFSGITFSDSAEGSSCWTTPGVQQLSGTYNLAGSGNYIVSLNQTGDCINEGSPGTFYVASGYTNSSQTIRSDNTITNDDTNFYFGALAWSRAAQGDACWTVGTQQLSGFYTIGANASMVLSANQTGQCNPTAPVVSDPDNGYYERADTGSDLYIAQGVSTSPTTLMPLDHYRLDLINASTGTVAATITANNALNTNYSFNTSAIGTGLYKVLITALNNFSISNMSNSSEISLYNFSYDSGPIYETNITTHRISWTPLTGHTSAGAYLNWSGTVNASTAGAFVFQPNLETTNNTAHTFYWIVNDSATSNASTSHTQNVLWAYFPISLLLPSEVIEASYYLGNLTIGHILSYASLTGVINLNGTNFTTSATNATLYQNTSIYVPTVATSPATLTSNGTLNSIFNSITTSRSVTGNNLTVYIFNMTNCTNTSYAMNFSMVDELTGAPVNFSTFNAIASLYTGNPALYRSYTFNLQNVSYAAFCISPENFSANVSWVLTYEGIGYPPRGLAQVHTNMESPSSHENITLSSVNGSYYTFVTVSQMNSPIQNAHILAYRNGILVQSGLTNPDGTSAFLLQPYFPYTFNVSASGYISQSFNFTPTTTTTMTIRMNSTTTLPSYNNTVDLFKDITITITPRNTSYQYSPFNITMTIVSGNSALTYWGAKIYRIVNGTITLVYNSGNITNSSGGTLTYLANQTGQYQLKTWFKEPGYAEYDPWYYWTLSNGTRFEIMQGNISGFTSGWGWYFLAVVGAMLVAGFISRYSVDGAGAAGLMVLWGFTVYSPSTFCVLGGELTGIPCITPFLATVFTTLVVGAALYLKNPM